MWLTCALVSRQGKTSRALKTEKKELEAQLVSAEKKLAVRRSPSSLFK